MSYGERLVKLRGKRSQEDAAKGIGISRARLSHYENERSEPDFDTLTKLSHFYRVPIDYIVNGTDYRDEAKRIITDSNTNIAASDGDMTEEEAIRALEFILKREKNRKPGDKQ